ncbi:MAG: NAD(P)/FAD-dependent oxidoreductase [Candidatus Cloacimonetes bacterium]|nr:NAD(P)/FAD-dependent oxidoreductase [Candidatus Cloacimonadota bacterium]
MEKVNILIIGAGVVGLSIGKYLSEKFEDVIVVDKEDSFGRHTSSRNSEVIHSGIYYPQNTLKAKMCVEGNHLLYEFCERNSIPFRKTGKLVVATNEAEYLYLDELKINGERNHVDNLKIIYQDEIKELEPLVIAEKALFVPSTGIIDTHKLMYKLANQIEENDGFVIYEMEVIEIEYSNGKYLVKFSNGEEFQANIVINSAGIYCESIAKILKLDTIRHNIKIHWCKGEYYKTSKLKNIKHLIYPVPDQNGIFLGIHLTVNLNNDVRFGPNAFYIDEINYRFDESFEDEFYKAIMNYLPLEEGDLHPDDCGIRAKLQGQNDEFRDFYIKEESIKGLPNFINLMGIESPGLTSCLAIGKYVKDILN